MDKIKNDLYNSVLFFSLSVFQVIQMLNRQSAKSLVIIYDNLKIIKYKRAFIYGKIHKLYAVNSNTNLIIKT